MYFVSFYMNRRERSCRAEVLTCTASDTSLFVHNRNPWRPWVVRILPYHADRTGRTVSCTVAAAYIVSVYDAIVKINYGKSYLDR